MTPPAQLGLEIIEARLSSQGLIVRYRLSNKGKTPAQYISGAAKESWPKMPFVRAEYSQKVLHTELTVAECPKDRLIEVPYAYRLEQLEPNATIEGDLRIRGPVFENRPYAMTENRTAIDVSGRLETVRLHVGVLRRPPGDKAESVFIGCASNVKSEGYTIVTSEKKF